jgi:hypothetical protein
MQYMIVIFKEDRYYNIFKIKEYNTNLNFLCDIIPFVLDKILQNLISSNYLFI